ncbi:unnamed protein product [Rotaria socialis]|uniref:Uncharacterized protein n=2 Tax=Rotaria socialis TaxID=392032 RepID=A0A817YNK1_9BILA|nr:unnamed protein product [Rotaria socialis]CAF3320936.1 unnamed protein product [Rotaria socialis]CAF3384214.1 unnamed protein product [Rotaria socialis]CAF4309519.1 unnamed protein product [Rotaria socialis]CAF4439458.1 unnamed protein product [Rotaria socialis]
MIEETSPVANCIDTDRNDNKEIFTRPNILLTGLRRSGKTSIQRVIFTKMAPSQTQFLKSTPQLTVNRFSCGSFISFQIQELPGQLHVFPSLHFPNNDGANHVHASMYDDDDDVTHLVGGGYNMERLLKRCNAVVYIIDAQDDYAQSVSSLNMIIESGQRVNPRLRYEIFIHKVDQLSEEAKIETQRDIHNQVRDRFPNGTAKPDTCTITQPESSSNSQNILINFHLTSIFDHSIFEAFSKVIQKLIPQFKHLEELLNYLISASNIEQAFLFDVQTKISIATDSSPTDMQMYELCCDMIDLFISMSQIYGRPNGNVVQAIDDDADSDRIIRDEQSDEHTEMDSDGNNESVANGTHSSANSDSNSSLSTTPVRDSCSSSTEATNENASNVFDSMSSSIVKLTGGRALYLKEISRHLALICVLREEALTKQAIIEYNVNQLKKSILELFRLTHLTSPVA